MLNFYIKCAIAIIFITSSPVLAAEDLSLIVTSNLAGRFSIEEANQEKNDPMLLLAQSMLAERKRGNVDIYLDLGNAFYPGLLSKYSYGSVMMDYFNFFSCDATLVSSKDLRIGADNLQFLRTGKNTGLLSANIMRNKKPLFRPYFLKTKGNAQVAFVAISSKKIRFDIAEKNLYKIQLKNEADALSDALKALGERSNQYIVLLSGLDARDTIALLASFKQIQMALCGGDSTGELFSAKASRIDLADGRTVLLLPEGAGYYYVKLRLDARVSVDNVRRMEANAAKTDSRDYREFVKRLTLWKRKFKTDEDSVIFRTDDKKYTVNDYKFAALLRDRLNTEIAVVEKNTIIETSFSGNIKGSDLLQAVNLDYNIFIFTLPGEDLKNIAEKDETLIVSGITDGHVQGYHIKDDRMYRVAATQPAYEKIRQLLEKNIIYQNTWENVRDTMLQDIKGKHIIFKDDFAYIDRYFRYTVDFYLSNFIESTSVNRGNNIETPLGESEESYRKWGLENKIDLTIYNRYHYFIFTPYMLYVRQDQEYLNNLLRGTFVYNLNLYDIIKPYHKSQADTVVKATDGLRPVAVRETIGLNAVTNSLQIKLGAGFEKEVHEPAKDAVYGIETLVAYKLPFLNYFTYVFNLDNFISARAIHKTERLIRTTIQNTLSVSVNQFLSISFKHRWFYFYSGEYQEIYRNSQFVTSADLVTDFKMW